VVRNSDSSFFVVIVFLCLCFSLSLFVCLVSKAEGFFFPVYYFKNIQTNFTVPISHCSQGESLNSFSVYFVLPSQKELLWCVEIKDALSKVMRLAWLALIGTVRSIANKCQYWFGRCSFSSCYCSHHFLFSFKASLSEKMFVTLISSNFNMKEN